MWSRFHIRRVPRSKLTIGDAQPGGIDISGDDRERVGVETLGDLGKPTQLSLGLSAPGQWQCGRLEQLRGKKINFSDVGSATQWLLRDLFARLAIDVQEVNVGQGDAREKMRAGEVSATILTSEQHNSC